jgi:hypothetical protein
MDSNTKKEKSTKRKKLSLASAVSMRANILWIALVITIQQAAFTTL